MSVTRKGLRPAPGVTPAIGFYLAGMGEVREQLREAVGGMSDEEIGRHAVPGAHSVGALVLHIGEAEWFWMQCWSQAISSTMKIIARLFGTR